MLDSIYHLSLRFNFFLPNSGVASWLAVIKTYIQCNRFLLYIFICFYSECILVDSSIRVDTQF